MTVMVDTNVLVYDAIENSPHHDIASKLKNHHWISIQIIRENVKSSRDVFTRRGVIGAGICRGSSTSASGSG